jgi:indole-3-acetate monooxygenase
MKTTIETTSHPISPAFDLLERARKTGPLLNQHINEEETERRLSAGTVRILKEGGFLRLTLPESLGGLEADPITIAKTVEEIARHNTAAGWSMMVANTGHWSCSKLPERGIEEIYQHDPDTLVAGAFHPPMQATPVQGGYRISGRSPLTSNVHEAHWIFVTAFVMEQSRMKMHNGMPEVIGVFMDAKDCQIFDTWHTIGMRATDSNDVEASEVFVPAHRSHSLAPGLQPNRYCRGDLYQFPVIGVTIASVIAPVALAVATNAVQELKQFAEKKVSFGSMVSMRERGSIQRKLGMAEAMVKSCRAYLHETLRYCWDKMHTGGNLTLEDKADLLLASVHTNQSCLQAVDLMYSAAGSSAIYTRNKLAHYFTDAQVIRQHGFVNESRYETAAQVFFGLPPDLPVLAL